MAELLSGKIYSIRSPNTEMVYVGSTIVSLKQRFAKHVYDWKTKTHSYTSYLILEKGDAYIELIEEVEVESERELKILEQVWIDNTPNTVNKNRAYVTDEERAQNHRDCSREYGREHKEKVAEVYKKYYEANKEELAEYHKKYYEANKEKIAERQKKNREKNKEKLKKKRTEKVLCEVCDCSISRGSKSKHNSSKKHISNLENVAQQ